MKNKTMLLLIIVIVIAASIFLVVKTSAKTVDNEEDITQPIIENNIQKITLSMKNGNYYPREITVKEGIPLSITLDNSVTGCYRSFIIRPFINIKYSANPLDTVDFIPDEKGTFVFGCSMNMASGKLIVE